MQILGQTPTPVQNPPDNILLDKKHPVDKTPLDNPPPPPRTKTPRNKPPYPHKTFTKPLPNFPQHKPPRQNQPEKTPDTQQKPDKIQNGVYFKSRWL